MNICKHEGCNGLRRGLGYCNRHYKHLIRHGKPLDRTNRDPNKIIIESGYALIKICDRSYAIIAHAIIDLNEVDRCNKYRWHLANTGYASNHKIGELHNFILRRKGDVNNPCDHFNRNKLDNRKDNLIIVLPHINAFNKGIQKNNRSGITGVQWHKGTGKWRPFITYKKRMIYSGLYMCIDDAAKVREKLELKYYGRVLQLCH